MRNTYKSLVEKPAGKRPLGRPRLIYANNIRVDLREIGWEVLDWMELTQDRDQSRVVLNMIMDLRVV
jgi:hypothetical protein